VSPATWLWSVIACPPALLKDFTRYVLGNLFFVTISKSYLLFLHYIPTANASLPPACIPEAITYNIPKGLSSCPSLQFFSKAITYRCHIPKASTIL
jgi:hypothetical protein